MSIEITSELLYELIHLASGGSASEDARKRIIRDASDLLSENSCEACGDTGVIEPESGCEILDKPFPCKCTKSCPHYEDNQGFCHKCGILMNEERAYMSGYHPNQSGMADKFDEPPEFDVAGGL